MDHVDRSTLASVVIQSVVSPQETIVITDCEFVVNANKRKDSLVYISKLQLEHSLDCFKVRNISTSAMRLQATNVSVNRSICTTIKFDQPCSFEAWRDFFHIPLHGVRYNVIVKISTKRT
ncbi:hypothetical protein BASA60_001565 [Batrachochytrium salamandrivorans]|nr:hypothetical protein BASA60_001565 [Batrachochytrium salamandrivorans]